MIQFVKFLALTVGLVFSGSNVQDSISSAPNQSQDLELSNHELSESNSVQADTLKKEIKDLSRISQIPMQPSDHHACGMAHAHEVMRSEDPDYDKKLEYFKNVTLPELQKEGKEIRQRRSGAQTTISMPIVFHIIHKPGEAVGTGQNLTDQTIIDQLETLNEDLAALNSGWATVPQRWDAIKGNPDMQFCLAEIDPTGAPTTGIVRHEYSSVPDRDFIRNTIKPQTHWNTNNYYNVWILPIPGTSARGGVLGWAFFPSAHGSNFDGTVQDYRFTGKGGKTLTHEVGHSFGLPHVWGSGGCGNDDGIADTPPQETDSNSIQRMRCDGTNFPTGPMSCGNEHMYINYMDYSPDACALTFTIGQGDAMRGIANGRRASLSQNSPVVAASCSTGVPTGGGNPTGGGGGPVVTIENDAGIQAIIAPQDGDFCNSQDITPVVLLINTFGETPLTSCEIRYKISGIPGNILFNWTGNLAKGESIEVSLQPFASPDFSFELTAWAAEPNGVTDENSFNDEKATSLVVPEVFDPNIFEDFEDETTLPTSTMIEVVDPGSTSREWEISSSSAYGVGSVSAVFRNFNDPDAEGDEDILEFPLLNFGEIENPRIAFDLAYYDTNTNPAKDTLMVRVSTDCGESFTTVYKEGGANLATVSQQQAAAFTPEANEWKNVVVDLFDFNGVLNFAGAEKVQIEIVNIGYGNNNLYIDNLNLSDGCASNVQVISSNQTCPDECDGLINLLLNGFVVPPQITWSNNVNGQTGEAIEGLCAGIYSVTVIDSEFDCEFIQEIEITAPDEISLIVNGNNISNPGLTNGSVDVQAFGGTSFFTYEWDNGITSTEPFLLGLAPGTYCVTATDQAGCTISDCYTVTGFDCVMDVELIITQPECGQSEGSAELIVTGANNPRYAWFSGINGISQTSVSGIIGPGFYVVNVTDNGLEDCTETFSFIIYDTDAPQTSATILDESTTDADDGSITLNLSEPDDFTYVWSTGTSTGPELTDLGEGSYTVTLTDTNTGCEFEETFNITDLKCTIDVSQNITGISCFGETDGAVVLQASGGVGPYTYDWPTGPSFRSRINLDAGIFAVTVTDNSGCRRVVDVIVTQPAMLNTVLTTVGETNPGDLNGEVSAQIFGGTMPYDIDWSTNDQDVQVIDNLGGGLYFITVTDANGCSTVTGASVEGRMCPDITAVATSTNVSCFGAADGTLSVTATGGIEPYTYLWLPGNFDQATVANAPPGDYTVTVMDADGCPATAQVSITQPDEFTVTLVGEDETSLGAGDGSITSTVDGGVGTLTYAWSGPPSFAASTQNISFLSPAEYCVTITDETNCTAEACLTIGAGADPCVNFEIVDFMTVDNVCNGGTDGLAIVLIEGGLAPYTYEWSDMTSDSETASGLPAGTISVIITDANDCSIVGETVINEPATPLDISVSSINESAPGANNGSATANLSGGDAPYSYVWTGPSGFTATTMTIEDLEPGTYCVISTDGNGCELEETCVTVVAGSDPCVNISISADINADILTCINTETEVSFTATGGTAPYSVIWSVNDLTTETIFVDEPGQIRIMVTDANGCSGQAISFIEQDISEPQFNLETTVPSSATAADGSAFVANVSPGTTTVAWFDSENILIGEETTIDGLAEGTYEVVLTNPSNGCTSSEIFDLVAEMADCTAFSISLELDNISCVGAADGLAQIDYIQGTGPYTHVWSPALPDNAIQSDLTPGAYSVTVTDANGCMDNLSFEVFDPEEFTVSFFVTEVTSSGANDGMLTAVLEAGVPDFSYAWSNGETSQTITGLSEGEEYCVTVVDGNGCSAENCATLEIFTDACVDFDVELVFTQQITCFEANDGALQVNINNAVEPITYEWSNELPGTQQQTDLEPGVYSVTVTDANNCEYVSELELTEPESELTIELSSTTVSTIGGTDGTATVIPTGGNVGIDYTYVWDDQNQQTTPTAIGLSPGEYCVTVASGGCFAEECITVLDLDNPCIDFSSEIITEDASCFDACDGTAIINIVGGLEPYQFVWSDGVSDSQRDDLCGSDGIGSVTVTDANGCSAILEFLIDAPDELEVIVSSTNASDMEANDGSASAAGFGGTPPYTYNWDNEDSGETIENLVAGTYTVTVTDANGCTVEDSVVVGVGDDQCSSFQASLEITDVSCFGENDGSAIVITEGGFGTLLFDWIDSNTLGATETGLGAGDFTVIVTDQNGCEVSLQGTITQPDELIIDVLSAQAASSATASDGSASIEVSGGTGDLEITWSDGLGSELTQDDLTSGIYSVMVVDENGCTTTEMIIIEDGSGTTMDMCDNLSASFVITPVSCFNELDGAIEVFPAGGAEPYDITSSAQSFTGLQSGLVTIIVEDANGCIFSEDVLIPTPNPLTVNAQGFDGNCGLSGTAEAVVSGGTGPFDIMWSNGDTGPFINGLETGDYEVTVTDVNGCETESTVSVTVAFNPLSFDVTTTDASCDDAEDGRISIDVTNVADDSGLEFMWNDGVITKNRLNLAGGTYTVTITDEVGCEFILSRDVRSPDPIVGSFNVQPGATGSLFDVSVNATGGSGVYSFDWSDNTIGFLNTGLTAGEYEVTITDTNGCSSTLLVDVNGTTAVLNNLDIISEFEMSPNPTTGAFFLEVTLTEVSDIQVSVFDILGREVISNSYRGITLKESLDLGDRAAGAYFVRIFNEEGQLTKKLIKVD